ncbi:hypothetical protein [Pseudoalteromonas sp. NBT06-2]|nr:hypothetical protein [Pseudoalteromonas sp. NBT06-2]
MGIEHRQKITVYTDNLYKEFKKVKSAKGAAGIDGQSIGVFALVFEVNLK